MASSRDQKIADPSTPSFAHKVMAPRIAKMRAVLGGTEAMREAGELYLPRHEAEKHGQYEERLARSTLDNRTKLTLLGWVGTVFKKPIERDESLPEEIYSLFDDIDLDGKCMEVFVREWFKDGLSFGLSPMLVMFPPADPTIDEDGVNQPRRRTLRDDQEDGRRPYWLRLAPENIIDVRTVKGANGRTITTHLRVLGERVEYDGFLETIIPQIYVYTDKDVTTYEYQKVGARKKEWVEVDYSEHDFGEVPLVVFYAEEEGPMVGSSVLFDLADLNIQHWQSTSDQINCLTVARFPMLYGVGVSDEQQIAVGPRKYLHSEDPNAKFGYVEHTGAALSAGAADLKSLEDRMSNYGSEHLKKRPGRETASARVLDSAEATSPIQDVALRFNDVLDHAIYFTAKWLRIPPPQSGALSVNTEIEEASERADGDEGAVSAPTQPQ